MKNLFECHKFLIFRASICHQKLNFNSIRISKILLHHDSEREKIDKKKWKKNCNQRQRDIWRKRAKENNEKNHQTRIRSWHAEALNVTWCPKLIYFCSFSCSFLQFDNVNFPLLPLSSLPTENKNGISESVKKGKEGSTRNEICQNSFIHHKLPWHCFLCLSAWMLQKCNLSNFTE